MGQPDTAGRWAELGERGALWGMRFVLLVWRLLGRRVCQAVIVPVVTWFWLTDAPRRRISLDWLARARSALGQPPPRAWHGLQHWIGFGTKALDSVVALQDPAAVGPLVVEDPDKLLTLAARGQGGMILVAHLGNPDLARVVLGGRLGTGMTVLMHTRHAASYNRLLDALHGDATCRTLEVAEMGPATAIDLQQRLERGEWLAMAADRTPPSANGRVVRVPFLGAPAAFPTGPWILAGLLQCPVFLLTCLKRPEGGYSVRLEHFADRVVMPRPNRDAAIRSYAARYAQRLQKQALAAPMQWYNFYDFWA